jgi:hypothetical protein
MQVALKEWQVAVDALAEGKTILLLRKGGIKEVGGRFRVEHDRVWLYPTYEHQQPALLQPAYAEAVQPVQSGWHPEQVPIRAWAEVTDILQTQDASVVEALQPFHIWNQQFVGDRLRWKPNQPLYLLLLRVYALLQPVSIPFSPRYGGCKSWIDLESEITPSLGQPVMDAVAYQTLSDLIRTIAAPLG